MKMSMLQAGIILAVLATEHLASGRNSLAA